jgi:hypothetical protein
MTFEEQQDPARQSLEVRRSSGGARVPPAGRRDARRIPPLEYVLRHCCRRSLPKPEFFSRASDFTFCANPMHSPLHY